MDLTSISAGYPNLQAAYSNPASDKLSQAQQNAIDKASKKTEGSKVQLSEVAQLRSAVGGVQDAAKGLKNLGNKQVSAEDAKKAVQAFADAYNKANSIANKSGQDGNNNGVSGANGSSGTAASGNTKQNANSAQNVVGDLRNSVTTDTKGSAADLKKLGLSVNKDGSLSFDQKAFDKAFKEDAKGTSQALSDLGGRVERTANQKISSKGGLDQAEIQARAKAALDEQKESTLRERTAISQKAQSQRLASSPFGLGGAESYSRIFAS